MIAVTPRALDQNCIAISKVWTTGMLVAAEGPPDKRTGAPTLSKIIELNFFWLHMNIIKS